MAIKFSNNASTKLLSSVSSTTTLLYTVIGGTGVFPFLNDSSDYFMLTIMNSDGSYEIVKCTYRTENTFTVVRGQEGTKPIYLYKDAKIENRLTAGSLNTAINDAIATTSSRGRSRVAYVDEAMQGVTGVGGPAFITPELMKQTALLPGTIVAYSGPFVGKHPMYKNTSVLDTTWHLCDGTNGTPDLKERMLIGASINYPAGTNGGSATHTHVVEGTVGETTLTEAQMPSHNHTVTAGTGSGSSLITGGDGATSTATSITGNSEAHTHSLFHNTSAVNSLPPYYALAYIIKL